MGEHLTHPLSTGPLWTEIDILACATLHLKYVKAWFRTDFCIIHRPPMSSVIFIHISCERKNCLLDDCDFDWLCSSFGKIWLHFNLGTNFLYWLTISYDFCLIKLLICYGPVYPVFVGVRYICAVFLLNAKFYWFKWWIEYPSWMDKHEYLIKMRHRTFHVIQEIIKKYSTFSRKKLNYSSKVWDQKVFFFNQKLIILFGKDALRLSKVIDKRKLKVFLIFTKM